MKGVSTTETVTEVNPMVLPSQVHTMLNNNHHTGIWIAFISLKPLIHNTILYKKITAKFFMFYHTQKIIFCYRDFNETQLLGFFSYNFECLPVGTVISFYGENDHFMRKITTTCQCWHLEECIAATHSQPWH